MIRGFIEVLLFLLLVFLCKTVFGQMQIEPPDRIQEFKRLLPEVEDLELSRIFREAGTLWYSSRSIEPAHQLGVRNGEVPPTRFSRVGHNNSGDFPERTKPHGKGGNANVDFPWAAPGGTHRTSGVDSFKFLSLPVRNSVYGSRWPVVWFRQTLNGDLPGGARQLRGYGWVFPVGTVIGEVLTQSGPRGRVTFEVRTRERGIKGWSFEVYRPYRTSADLVEAIRAKRPNRTATLNVSIVVMQTSLMEHARLVDRNRTKSGFDSSGWVDSLPDLYDDDLVYELLDEPFVASFGEHWKDECFAPTTLADFHIVPARYDAGFLGMDCMRCHESTGVTARSFDLQRGWYGHVRGSDGILSFHPVAPSAIGNGQTRLVRMRQSFIDSGIVARFDPVVHPNTVYAKILK